MHRSRRFWPALWLTVTLAMLGGCGDDGATPEPTTTEAAPRSSPSSTSTSATASTTTSTTVAAQPATLPPCNVFPESLAGTFQGSVIQVTPQREPDETWTNAAACLVLVAATQQGLSIELYQFPSDAGADTEFLGRSGLADLVPGWGDLASWAADSCRLVIRYGAILVQFEQMAPTPDCRTDIERIARAFTDHHFPQ